MIFVWILVFFHSPRDPLQKIQNKDLYYKLPNGLSWYHVEYILLYCVEYAKVMGVMLIDKAMWRTTLLPPAKATEHLFQRPRSEQDPQ